MGEQITQQQKKRLPVVQVFAVFIFLIAAIFGRDLVRAISEVTSQKEEISDEFIEDALKKVSTQINSDCPIVIDKATTLVSSQSINNTFKYFYVLDSEAFQGRMSSLEEELRPSVINYYCTSPVMSMFRELEVKVIYIYYDDNKNYLFEITILPEECSSEGN